MDLISAQKQTAVRRRSAVQDSDYYHLAGGLNTIQTPLQLQPGELIACLNYECRTLGGYRRFQGYERYDGHPAPSSAQFWQLEYTLSGTNPTVGQTITGGTSGATGVLLAAPATDPSTGNLYLILGSLSGTFVVGESVKVSATVFGTTTTIAQQGGGPTDALRVSYSTLAQAAYRTLIQPVPGSGPVLGVAIYKGNVYAFRNNSGGTAAVMYKATSSGWSAIGTYYKQRFNTGTGIIVEGNTITGATSGATAVVRRQVVQTGAWNSSGSGAAAGFLILTNITGTFTATENLKVGGTVQATATTVPTTQPILPGGQYEFRENNFYGDSVTDRLYGVDGVNYGFEYQDSPEFFCQIETGNTPDTPNHLAAHRGRLWYSFVGGSAQESSVNNPCAWSALTGAAEFGIGADITGFMEELQNSLMVFSAARINIIQGDTPNQTLALESINCGARPYTIQRLALATFLDNRGFSTLQQTLQYGNFTYATISQKVQNLIASITQNAACSTISKAQNLYRLFMNDGSFASLCFNDDKLVGITLCNLGGPVATCAFSGEAASGADFSLVGCSNGYVYQLDSGFDCDGQSMAFFLQTAYHFSKTPSRNKRYRRAKIDVGVEGDCTLSITAEYSFANPFTRSENITVVAITGAGAYWDTSTWDNFNWDSTTQPDAIIKLESSGTNVSFLISGTITNQPSHTIQGITLHQSMRRLERRSM